MTKRAILAAFGLLIIGCNADIQRFTESVIDDKALKDIPDSTDEVPFESCDEVFFETLVDILENDGDVDTTGPDVMSSDIENDEASQVTTCGFNYDFPLWSGVPQYGEEPRPSAIWLLPLHDGRADIVMPNFTDNMPLFDRAEYWNEGLRCYELPTGVAFLDEEEAWLLYKRIAETTTGAHIITTPGHRTVIGIRGAYPGTFQWNKNSPNRFNDTIVLLWRDDDDRARVLEFPGHTDTGAYKFTMASSLWPNRRYLYRCGWHNSYNALEIAETEYRVRDDANSNGHWDDDRNGWLPPFDKKDFFRNGSAHNIHVASVDAPLETAVVGKWSAGCQTIPGMANWIQFVQNVWTNLGDPVDYILVDARDIPSYAFVDCEPDGTHSCPYRITSFPYQASGDTTFSTASKFDLYNCSSADESGPEVVWVFTTQTHGIVTATVDDIPGDAGPDVDVHILMADDANACLGRGNVTVSVTIPPGRYFVVVDTFVKNGKPLSGPFVLNVDFH